MDMTGKSGETKPARPSTARRRLVKLLVLGILALVSGVVASVIAIYLQFGPLRSCEAYQMGLGQVQQDPTVIAQLGEPIRTVNWFPGGVLETNRADLHFPIAGPKGEAHVAIQARRLQGTWSLALLEVTFPNGKRHSIDTSDSAGEATEAPKWSPGM